MRCHYKQRDLNRVTMSVDKVYMCFNLGISPDRLFQEDRINLPLNYYYLLDEYQVNFERRYL
jgi:hypothetical protein